MATFLAQGNPATIVEETLQSVTIFLLVVTRSVICCEGRMISENRQYNAYTVTHTCFTCTHIRMYMKTRVCTYIHM